MTAVVARPELGFRTERVPTHLIDVLLRFVGDNLFHLDVVGEYLQPKRGKGRLKRLESYACFKIERKRATDAQTNAYHSSTGITVGQLLKQPATFLRLPLLVVPLLLVTKRATRTRRAHTAHGRVNTGRESS